MLQTSTIEFLKELKIHNEKPWFDGHKAEYLAAKTDFDHFITALLLQMGKHDPAIGLLRPKDCVFRIYRDVRFSKDKTPYKVHFAAGINKGGKKVHYPGYYIHIEPGGHSYLGGGIWRPEKEILHRVRQEIDYNFEDFQAILGKPVFRKAFGTLSEEDKLKRPPKGYEAENPAIEYVKLRSFLAGCSLEDDLLTAPDLVQVISGLFHRLGPFIHFLETAMDG